MAERPALFAGRDLRPIVRERALLAAHAEEHRVVLGLAAETPHVLLVVDLVESRGADGAVRRHPYMRVLSRGQLEGGVNVVVLATIADPSLGDVGDVVLVEQERHAPGTRETELPRGMGEPALSGEANALRELADETGYEGDRAHFLGWSYTDSGLTDARVSFYHVPVVRRSPARPETEEAITAVRLASTADVRRDIRSGAIRDAFTVQALALYEGRRDDAP
jgi:ADP-ribose pyrophosphatase